VSKQSVGFADLLTQVCVVTDKSIDINNTGIEEHTGNLTSSFTESVLDSSIDGVTDSLLLLTFVLDSNDLLDISLDRHKVLNRVSRSLLLLLLLNRLLLLHGLGSVHGHLSRRHLLLVHHLLLLRNGHRHIVIVLVHSLLLVHVASATATATLSTTILIASIVVILSLHIVILVLVVEIVTTHIRNKIIKGHGKWITIGSHELFLGEHLEHLTTLLLLLSVDIFFGHPEINTKRLATENV